MLTPCQSGKMVIAVELWIMVVSIMGCIQVLVGRVGTYACKNLFKNENSLFMIRVRAHGRVMGRTNLLN